MAAPYGATLDGVRAHLPHARFGPDTRPSEDNVEHFLARIGAQVRARTGDLSAHADTEALTDLARTAVELGAASLAESAAFPERADQASTSYAAVLWEQYREALADLLLALGIDVTEPAPGGGGGTAGTAAGVFPEPLVTRAIGF